MLSPEASEEAAVPAPAATVGAANSRRVVATGNRASAERSQQPPKKGGEGNGNGAHRTVAPASSPRPSAPTSAAVLGLEPEASGSAAAQPSKLQNPGASKSCCESNTAGRTRSPAV